MGQAKGATSPNMALAMLFVVYTFNFLDRQVLSILAQPIKLDLGLSDGQVGALGGLAFAMLFSTMAIPLGLLADRTGRVRVVGVSLAVWSGFTVLCGLAGNFTQIFLFRLGVGVGEAGGVAPSYALITGYFPPGRRARALAIYSTGAPLGIAIGVLFGSAIAAAVNWRLAFIVLGLAGLLTAIPYFFLMREPQETSSAEPVPAREVFRRLAALPLFWLLAFGAACSSLAGYGLSFWMPALVQRSYGLTLVQTGQFIGVLVLITGVAGVLAGGFLGDRFGNRDRSGYPLVGAWAFAICGPAFAAALFSPDPVWLFFLMLVPSGLAYMWMAPVITTVQHLVSPRERATASACYLLVNNSIGLGLGPLAVGSLSDYLAPAHGTESLRLAMVAVACFYPIAALLMFIAAPRVRAAWQD